MKSLLRKLFHRLYDAELKRVYLQGYQEGIRNGYKLGHKDATQNICRKAGEENEKVTSS